MKTIKPNTKHIVARWITVSRHDLVAVFSIAVLAIISLTTSCSTSQKQTTDTAHDLKKLQRGQRHPQARDVEQRILEQYHRWKGSRHRLGGTGSNGIDCSGFVKAVYRDVFHMDLPRTTNAQVRQGKPVSFEELQPGDLVFFTPPNYPRHVGIFLSQSQFVHASKSKGVTISKIDAAYWGKYYWTARRILHSNK